MTLLTMHDHTNATWVFVEGCLVAVCKVVFMEGKPSDGLAGCEAGQTASNLQPDEQLQFLWHGEIQEEVFVSSLLLPYQHC